jgi:hypothetical protein
MKWLLAWLALACVGQTQAAEQTLTLSCAVAYMPARSTWVREVQLEWKGDTLSILRIDGLTPHSFSVHADTVATAMDNERIQIDLRLLQWVSDFRGLASGQGRCDTEGH